VRHKRVKKIVHGQEVWVTVYESDRINPIIASGAYMDEIVSASSERIEAIKGIKEKYLDDCTNVIMREEPDEGFFVQDFSPTPSLEDQLEREGHGNKHIHLPLDKQLEKLGIS
jgi:hypothetical protein